ncbi:MAG: hypothetical protein R3279_13370 [Putridiphycobacter sp.]|nr:hypothetical protein [Putridiphycobacter sp.]
MKVTIYHLIIGLLLTTGFVSAQNIDSYIEVSREVLKTEKKTVIAEAMTLNDSESESFWTLYNAYNEALYKIHTQRVNIIKDFAANYETMTDEKADELWTRGIKYQEEILKLNKKFYKKFKGVLPASKAALYFQLENKIAALINAELALEIPVIQVE